MSSKHGFTLVELSIVLVVIGLIVGGILAGSDLIKAAELRSVISDAEKYRTAIYAFRTKYRALPGDMRNATKYWGAANSDPAICKATASNGKETCDGDGNRMISTIFDTTTYYEWFRFWQHLANAELIGGAYTGVAGSGGLADANIGQNVPAGKIDGSGWTPRYLGYYGGDSVWFAASYQNFLVFGSEAPNWSTNDKILTPAETFSIDQKIDDGKPGKGGIIAVLWDNCTDAANQTDLNANYAFDTNNIECGFALLKAF